MSLGDNGMVPQFSYGVGFGTTFVPTYAPSGKIPIDPQKAIRHDSITTSGLQQSVTERVDRLCNLEFKNVPTSDLAAWDAFATWAIEGKQFQYAPDSTNPSTYNTYYLVGMGIPPKFIAPNLYSLSMSMRQVLTAEIGS